MIRVNDLKATTSKRIHNKIELPSAKTVDKITGNVLQSDYDLITVDQVTEFITIKDGYTYESGHKKEQIHYIIRVDGTLKLVSEQAFNLIRNIKLKKVTIVKGEELPYTPQMAQDYINLFYEYPNQYWEHSKKVLIFSLKVLYLV